MLLESSPENSTEHSARNQEMRSIPKLTPIQMCSCQFQHLGSGPQLPSLQNRELDSVISKFPGLKFYSFYLNIHIKINLWKFRWKS